ncbi:hypothetical protein LMH87_010733 [Akanthomyces muscarius]|uniref:Methyltransferase n=1 Tax=Akanthomyces muscarius TaxID=2231603 RepID=A0A9W8UK86_AKAMU|nr:hypothetical protein LMH87_010733 [Akanthomyces muscarius]KAJ4149961.1 hypothetical protein LMH87_010733 [Akanthomyces muscarius]
MAGDNKDKLGQASDQVARLNYIRWQDVFKTEKPYEVLFSVPQGRERQNFELEAGPEQRIQAARGRESQFNLDTHGFEFRRQTMELELFTRERIESLYFASIRSILGEAVGDAAEVVIFDWRLRSSDQSRTIHDLGVDAQHGTTSAVLLPVCAVHNDQSRLGAIKRVRYHMGDRADDLLRGRVRIINIWRPLRFAVEDFPLAVCDGSSVPPESLVSVDHVTRGYIGESYYPLYHASHRWYYLDKQTKDEVLLFKTFDSSADAKAKCCPHTALPPQDVGASHNPRESIEVRALVFTKG